MEFNRLSIGVELRLPNYRTSRSYRYPNRYRVEEFLMATVLGIETKGSRTYRTRTNE